MTDCRPGRTKLGQKRTLQTLSLNVGKMRNHFLFSVLLFPLVSHACSFAPGFERFTPSIDTFEAKLNGDRIASLPSPTVSGIRVKRGTASSGSSCDDAGILTLDLLWPKSSIYKINEVGFYFRVLSGRQPDQIFPLEPISGKIVGQRARFTFLWLDGAPSDHRPLRLDVEVFAVNKGLQIGAAHRFQVTDEMP